MRKIILIMTLFTFMSCVNEPSEFNTKEVNYAINFEKRYGNIAQNQDWGFDKLITRAITKESNEHLYKNAVIPDVSPEEIKMVTDWFDTHSNPKTLSLDWCNFWVIPIYVSEHSKYMNQICVGERINKFGSSVLIEDGNTKVFSYHNSGIGKTITDKYSIQKIGNSYYVGFYYHGGKNDNVLVGDNDGLYNDMIFKLEPAVYKDTYRIIAEDLGNICDFDFNDVVFDFHKVQDGYVVTLQAVGGTLPLYIGDKEVHEAFGVSQSTFVNNPNLKLPPVMFKTNSLDITVIKNKAVPYKLKSECGKAPQKICVPITYEWTIEGQSIETKYPKFKNWVGYKEIDWIE